MDDHRGKFMICLTWCLMMRGLNEEGELISEGKCVIISNFAVAEPSGA